MGGTRTRPRDAREKRNKRARRRRNIKGSTACDGGRVLVIKEFLIRFLDVSECKEQGYKQGTRIRRRKKQSGWMKDDYQRIKGM